MVCLAKQEMNSLKWGKLYIPNCYYLTRTADPTGCLKKDQVCINCVMVCLAKEEMNSLKRGKLYIPNCYCKHNSLLFLNLSI